MGELYGVNFGYFSKRKIIMSSRDVTLTVIVFGYQWLNLCYLLIYVCCVGKHDGFDYL